MKRYELIEYIEKLENLSLKNYNKYVLFVVQKTISQLKTMNEEIMKKDSERFTQEFKKFEEEKRELLNLYGKKDEDGELIVIGNQVQIENTEEFNDLYVKLVASYRSVLDKFDEDSRKMKEYMMEEVSDKFLKIDFKHIPEHLDIEEYSVLSKLIDEDTVKI
jgi:hypothetical protein